MTIYKVLTAKGFGRQHVSESPWTSRLKLLQKRYCFFIHREESGRFFIDLGITRIKSKVVADYAEPEVQHNLVHKARDRYLGLSGLMCKAVRDFAPCSSSGPKP